MSNVKIMQKKKAEKMTPDEIKLVKRVMTGKEKIYEFTNADDVISSLHNACGK